MKIRTGFVSNSSSSSFIVIGKEDIEKVKEIIDNSYYDYFEYDNKLYTSMINDCSDIYNSISDLSVDSNDGDSDSPYNEEDFNEFEGDRGICSVWIGKDIVLKSDLTKLKEELLSLNNPFVNNIVEKYKRLFNESSRWFYK